MSLPYLGTIYPELADPDSELQKAQDLLNGFNKDVISE